jgi:hypothetical protein
MWPIAVAIVVGLAGYTYLRLAYSKPGKPHEPYADSLRRVESDKLKAAGWTRVDAPFEPMVDLPALDAEVQSLVIQPEPVEELRRLSAENWHLPIEYAALSTPARIAAGSDLTVHFQAELDQARAQIVSFDLFRKGADLVAIPRWEPYPAELMPRRPRAIGATVFPAAALPPGSYHVTFPALKQSSQWQLTVTAPPST